jgi:hypothetical protein
MDYENLIGHFGSCTKAARALGFAKQTVHRWKDGGIPFEKQFIIQMRTKGKLKATMPAGLRGPTSASRANGSRAT